MPNTQRVGDPNTAGGIVTSGIATVRVNGRAIVVPARPVTPHPCCGQPGCGIHCSAVTAGGSPNVRAGGLPVIRTGVDVDTCGHPRAGGSGDVRVN
jgi:uncharacterized Zn-binding protein involved in type VI secretion|nr:hypothetical protein [Oxalobacteraceae bacterium]